VTLNFGNNLKSSKCISGVTTFLGHCLIDWQCTQQSTVALSTCEAEISALVDGVTQLLYLRDLLSDLNLHLQSEPIHLQTDSQSTIAMINSGGKFRRTKHFLRRLNFLRDAKDRELFCAWLHVDGQNASRHSDKTLSIHKHLSAIDLLILGRKGL